MASWVTHLMIADRVMEKTPGLLRHEFCVGSIAPDCNVENEDWTQLTPSREVTHWMSGERKGAADCQRFCQEYLKKRENATREEEAFLLGYYAHLIEDAEFQRYIREEQRVAAAWKRIEEQEELREAAKGMDKTWDSIKKLIGKKERMQDICWLESEYLDAHPQSGYLTEILPLKTFPDYIDYLPQGAIPRKVKVMSYLPEKEQHPYAFLAMTREKYGIFLARAEQLVCEALQRYRG